MQANAGSMGRYAGKRCEHRAICRQTLGASGDMQVNAMSMGGYAGKHCEHGALSRQKQSIYTDQQASTPVVLSDKREHRIVGLINGRSDKVQLRKIDNTPVSVSMHTHLQHAKHPCTTSPTVPAAGYTTGNTPRSLRSIVRPFAPVCAKSHSGTKKQKIKMVQN